MTQLEMTTSTESAGSGIASIRPLRKWTFATPASRGVLLCEREHLVGHVEAVRDAGRPDAPGGEDDVDAAAGAEIEHDFALVQIGHRCRVAAAEAGQSSCVGKLAPLVARVERLAEGAGRVVFAAGAAAAACAGPLCDRSGGLGVALANLLANGVLLSAAVTSVLIGRPPEIRRGRRVPPLPQG